MNLVELLLNLCWLAVALAAFGYWRATRDPERKASSLRTATEALALTCALIFLFYPMSLTDDLHPDIFLAAECSAGRRSSPALSAGKVPVVPTAPVLRPFAAAVPSVPNILLTASFVGLPSQRDAFCQPFGSAAARGRAPPQV
jgi:hypothetical protein